MPGGGTLYRGGVGVCLGVAPFTRVGWGCAWGWHPLQWWGGGVPGGGTLYSGGVGVCLGVALIQAVVRTPIQKSMYIMPRF